MDSKRTTSPPIDETAIAEQAARWQAALRTASPQQLAEFSAWLKMSPRHGHHFLHATALDQLLSQIDPDRARLDPQAWIAEAQGNVVSLRGDHSTEASETRPVRVKLRLPFTLRTGIAAGLIAVLMIVGALMATRVFGSQDWITRTGEQRVVELEDGSMMYLNTATHVSTRFNAKERHIRLLSGEALFKVHRDSRRPFRVHTSGGVIQAVGTQFNVYRRDDGTQVYVLEGAVRITGDRAGELSRGGAVITPAALTAGEEARIKPDGEVTQLAVSDAAKVTAWRQRRLVFRADSLGDLAAEFNRYNQMPKFRLDGVDGELRHYTGTFDADDPESFATVLSLENFYDVERAAGEIIIRERARDARSEPKL